MPKKKLKQKLKYKTGCGLLNSIINKIPIELHAPGGYQYCGPGTKLKKRLARGDEGINLLDKACKKHDIAYDKYTDTKERYKADKELASEAWKRVKSRDASIGERATALSVTAAMRAKMGLTKIGGGCVRKNHKKTKPKNKSKRKKGCTMKKRTSKSKKTTSFNTLLKNVRAAIRRSKPTRVGDAVKTAVDLTKKIKRIQNIKIPRVIPIPKSGGALPLIPIFAGLSALGALVGSSTNVARTIAEVNRIKSQLQESERHNKTMEAIAIGKSKTGDGLYLKPYKNGYGLYLAPYNGNSSKNL